MSDEPKTKYYHCENCQKAFSVPSAKYPYWTTLETKEGTKVFCSPMCYENHLKKEHSC